MPKMTPGEIVRTALIWAEESMAAMVDGCHESDPYRADVADQLKQVRAYRKRRFGAPVDRFAGCVTVSLDEIREQHKACISRFVSRRCSLAIMRGWPCLWR